MSYKCDKCEKVRKGSEMKHVSEVRNVTYNKNFVRFDRRDRKSVTYTDSSSNGTEIVVEQRLCEKCHDVLKDNPAKVSAETKYVDFIGEKRKEVDTPLRDGAAPDFKGLKEKFEGRR
jgi:hypothetical protein